MFNIKKYNNIAQVGLDQFAREQYHVGDDIANPDAILLRSHNLHNDTIPASVKAIARAGAGVNNIPIPELSYRGVVVFNTPGANANAVKELVIAGILIASRNICQGWSFSRELDCDEATLSKAVEAGKKQFVGRELPGRTLAVIGLGAIGVQVANTAIALGMQVIGYDPAISIRRAWELSSQVKQAESLDEALANADFLTVHVPYNDQTHHLINEKTIHRLPKGAVLLNFARGGIVDEDAVFDAITAEHLAKYVCDFPSNGLKSNPKVVALPHLGASTHEAEQNCAVMAAKQLIDFLDNGNIKNSVNFPTIYLPRNGDHRITVANANVPNMLGQISTIIAENKLNIVDMINKSRDELAYTIVDIDAPPPPSLAEKLAAIDGILAVNSIPAKR